MIRLFAILLAVLIVLSAASGAHAARTYRVTYRVVGAHFDVTYTNATGGDSQETNRTRRWQVEFDAPAGAFLYVSAQNNGENGGVRCLINADGKRLQQASSVGEYVVASCSASLPD